MEQLFQGTRGVLGTMWASEYPTEELIDDISVSRPLQFYHECNMLKGKLLLEIYSGSRAPQPGDPWQQELQYIGRVSTSFLRSLETVYIRMKADTIYKTALPGPLGNRQQV